MIYESGEPCDEDGRGDEEDRNDESKLIFDAVYFNTHYLLAAEILEDKEEYLY